MTCVKFLDEEISATEIFTTRLFWCNSKRDAACAVRVRWRIQKAWETTLYWSDSRYQDHSFVFMLQGTSEGHSDPEKQVCSTKSKCFNLTDPHRPNHMNALLVLHRCHCDEGTNSPASKWLITANHCFIILAKCIWFEALSRKVSKLVMRN